MNLFGLGQPKIPTPDDRVNRPATWTGVTNPLSQLPRTRPRSVAEMCGLLSEFERQGRYEDATALLKMNASNGVKMWLRSVIDPAIPWRVDGNVDWEPLQFAEAEGALWSNLRKIYLFTDFPGIPSPLANVPEEKLYRQWSNFLSEHSRGEASILLMACEKRLPFHPDIVMEAFPELLGPIDQRQQKIQMASRLRESELKRLMRERENLKLHTEPELQAAIGTLKNREEMVKRYDDLIAQKLSELP